jgi:hypothetical protein
LTFNKRIIDIDCDEDVLGIFSRDALSLIKSGNDGWESMVPDFVDRIIKEKCLFGYCGLPYKSPTGPQEDTADAAARAIEQKD